MRIIIFIILLCINLLHIKAQVEERVVEGCIISVSYTHLQARLKLQEIRERENRELKFEGGTLVWNYEADRLQILFDSCLLYTSAKVMCKLRRLHHCLIHRYTQVLAQLHYKPLDLP